MSQLTLFDTPDAPPSTPEEPRQQGKALCAWQTRFTDCDMEYQQLEYLVLVRCREAPITRSVEGKKRTLPGYIVEVLYCIEEGEEPEEMLIQYHKDFLLEDKKKAIREYSGCIVQVLQWCAIAESRLKSLEQVEDPADCYECPFCGFMGLEWFETCNGCGKRFLQLEQ